jgi:hypothetical protein
LGGTFPTLFVELAGGEGGDSRNVAAATTSPLPIRFVMTHNCIQNQKFDKISSELLLLLLLISILSHFLQWIFPKF